MIKRFITLTSIASAVLLLSSCTITVDIDGAKPNPNPPIQQEFSASIDISYAADENTDAVTYNLNCDVDGNASGTHPNPTVACSTLEEAYSNYIAIVSSKRDACTMIYGGPETATISGLIRDTEIYVSLSRGNGCEIAEWDAWNEVLAPIASQQNTANAGL